MQITFVVRRAGRSNETEIREEFIIHLLHALGWRKGTTYDLEMEKPLKLSAPFHRIGRDQVHLDYAPSIRKRYFWLIEAKPGKERAMRMGDLLQAHLYAVHPEIQARLIVLTLRHPIENSGRIRFEGDRTPSCG